MENEEVDTENYDSWKGSSLKTVIPETSQMERTIFLTSTFSEVFAWNTVLLVETPYKSWDWGDKVFIWLENLWEKEEIQ